MIRSIVKTLSLGLVSLMLSGCTDEPCVLSDGINEAEVTVADLMIVASSLKCWGRDPGSSVVALVNTELNAFRLSATTCNIAKAFFASNLNLLFRACVTGAAQFTCAPLVSYRMMEPVSLMSRMNLQGDFVKMLNDGTTDGMTDGMTGGEPIQTSEPTNMDGGYNQDGGMHDMPRWIADYTAVVSGKVLLEMVCQGVIMPDRVLAEVNRRSRGIDDCMEFPHKALSQYQDKLLCPTFTECPPFVTPTGKVYNYGFHAHNFAFVAVNGNPEYIYVDLNTTYVANEDLRCSDVNTFIQTNEAGFLPMHEMFEGYMLHRYQDGKVVNESTIYPWTMTTYANGTVVTEEWVESQDGKLVTTVEGGVTTSTLFKQNGDKIVTDSAGIVTMYKLQNPHMMLYDVTVVYLNGTNVTTFVDKSYAIWNADGTGESLRIRPLVNITYVYTTKDNFTATYTDGLVMVQTLYGNMTTLKSYNNGTNEFWYGPMDWMTVNTWNATYSEVFFSNRTSYTSTINADGTTTRMYNNGMVMTIFVDETWESILIRSEETIPEILEFRTHDGYMKNSMIFETGVNVTRVGWNGYFSERWTVYPNGTYSVHVFNNETRILNYTENLLLDMKTYRYYSTGAESVTWPDGSYLKTYVNSTTVQFSASTSLRNTTYVYMYGSILSTSVIFNTVDNLITMTEMRYTDGSCRVETPTGYMLFNVMQADGSMFNETLNNVTDTFLTFTTGVSGIITEVETVGYTLVTPTSVATTTHQLNGDWVTVKTMAGDTWTITHVESTMIRTTRHLYADGTIYEVQVDLVNDAIIQTFEQFADNSKRIDTVTGYSLYDVVQVDGSMYNETLNNSTDIFRTFTIDGAGIITEVETVGYTLVTPTSVATTTHQLNGDWVTVKTMAGDIWTITHVESTMIRTTRHVYADGTIYEVQVDLVNDAIIQTFEQFADNSKRIDTVTGYSLYDVVQVDGSMYNETLNNSTDIFRTFTIDGAGIITEVETVGYTLVPPTSIITTTHQAPPSGDWSSYQDISAAQDGTDTITITYVASTNIRTTQQDYPDQGYLRTIDDLTNGTTQTESKVYDATNNIFVLTAADGTVICENPDGTTATCPP